MKKYIKNTIITKEFVIFFLIANLYFLLSNIPLMMLILKTPINTYFPLVHSISAIHDHYLYLSVITQGAAGNWLHHATYTSEVVKPGFFYIFFILVGKAASLFQLTPDIAYHLSRIISVELYIISIFVLAKATLKKTPAFWTSIIALLTTISPTFLYSEKGAFVKYSPWWEILDGLKRLDGLPHYVFGQVLLIFTSLFIILYLKKKKRIFSLTAAMFSFLSGIFLPYTALVIVLSLLILILIYIKNIEIEDFHTIFHNVFIKYLILIISFALFSLLLTYIQTLQGFPWTAWNKIDVEYWNKLPGVNRQILLSYGFLPVFALPGIIKTLRELKLEKIYLLIWTFMPLILLPFVNLISLGKIRLMAVDPYIPMAILAADGFFNSILPKIKKKRRKIAKYVFIGTILLINITISLHLLSLRITRNHDFPVFTNYYLPQNTFRSIQFIDNNLAQNSVFLSDEFLGQIIPAFTPNRSYYAHYTMTQDFHGKSILVKNFFAEEFEDEQALTFLKSNNIDYVYFGPDEKRISDGQLNYGFLINIYSSEGIDIFAH